MLFGFDIDTPPASPADWDIECRNPYGANPTRAFARQARMNTNYQACNYGYSVCREGPSLQHCMYRNVRPRPQ
jgi:hypothetical protein